MLICRMCLLFPKLCWHIRLRPTPGSSQVAEFHVKSMCHTCAWKEPGNINDATKPCSYCMHQQMCTLDSGHKNIFTTGTFCGGIDLQTTIFPNLLRGFISRLVAYSILCPPSPVSRACAHVCRITHSSETKI